MPGWPMTLSEAGPPCPMVIEPCDASLAKGSAADALLDSRISARAPEDPGHDPDRAGRA